MLKVCCTCLEEKHLNEFRRDILRADGRQSYCKVCARVYHKSLYVTKYKTKSDARNKLRSERVKNYVDSYREEHPCVCCGETCIACLDFHHIDPTEKDFTISSLRNGSIDRVIEEIKKCVVVCRNCHAKIHAGIINLERTSGVVSVGAC